MEWLPPSRTINESNLKLCGRGVKKVLRGRAWLLKSKKINLGAGDRDRTGMASLEGWGSTIELHPHAAVEAKDTGSVRVE